MPKFFLLILVIFTTSACASRTFVRSAPKYEHSLRQAKIAILLPPEVEVNSIDAFNKATRMYDYEDRVEFNIIDTLIPKIQEKGLNVKLLSRREIKDHKLSKDLLEIKDGFSDIISEFYSDGPWKEEKAFSINKSINGSREFYNKLNADLLIVLGFYSANKTSGAMAKDFTANIALNILTGGRSNINMENAERSSVKLAIIDAPTGKVLWTHSIGSSSDMISTSVDSLSDVDKVDKKRLSMLFDTALNDLPSISRSGLDVSSAL